MESTEVFHLGNPLKLSTLQQVVLENRPIALSESARQRINECREFLERKIEEDNQPVYGINTGFGSLYNHSVEGKDLSILQENLVKSHACGTGAEVDTEIVKLMLLLKVQALSFGYSGIRLEVVDRLITFYNEGLYPVVYEQGSLGASGDLAPLAHISLALLGEGEVFFKEQKIPAKEALDQLGMEPLALQSKEGLALLNGTQFMLAFGCHSFFQARKLCQLADIFGALSLEAYDGRPEPFDEKLMLIRPHRGQAESARLVREILEGSELIHRQKKHVQDPYSLRCIPQVHGASRDMLRYVESVLETEINSVTDNPTVFKNEAEILSGGNFHGQPLALALDSLAIACAELASISERRTYLLIGGQRELPPFLVAKPGLNSGLMIAQYTAASIVSQNKQLCTPASVDSITSSNGQEDHVSMGANAATKAYKVVQNLQTVLGIELLTASQAMFFREGNSSNFLMALLSSFREEVPFIEKDRILNKDIAASVKFIENLNWDLSGFNESA